MSKLGKWSFIGGIVLAIVAGFFVIPYVTKILSILGLIVGLLNVPAKQTQKYLVAVIALLVIGTASIQALGVIGSLYGITESILTNTISFIAASGLVVAIKEILTIEKIDGLEV